MKKKDIIFLAAGSAAVIAIIILINFFIGGPIRVDGSSMEPYLRDGDIVIINRLAYVWNNPKRFDLIVFPYEYNKSKKYIKRIIGLPGETVEIIDDKIYITDGERETYRLEEYYGKYEDAGVASASDYGPVTLGKDEFFVLGDNRYHSSDSRFDDVGLISSDKIIGKAVFRILPTDGFGGLD